MKYFRYLAEDGTSDLAISAIDAGNLTPVAVATRDAGPSKLADIPCQQGGVAR